MKKFVALMCVFALMLSLCACGEGTSPAPAGTESDGGVTLRFAWWGGQERNDITMAIIEMYKEVAPHVTIEPEMSGWTDYWTKLSTQAGAADLPDILQIRDPQLAQYAGRGQLANMDDLMKNFDASGVEDTVLGAGRIGDTLYMIPTGINAMSLVYDPAIYQQANALEPTLDWTWEEYRESAEKIHAQTGQFGASQFEPTSDLAFIQYLNSHGCELLSVDGTQLGFEEKLIADYFAMELEMTEAGIIPGPDLYGQRLAWEESFMVAGQAPSIFVYANNLGYLQTLCEGRDLALGPPPATDLGTAKASQISASMGFSIAENCQNKDEAMKFLDFFTNNLEVQTLEMLERGIPISSTVREAMKAGLDPVGAKVFAYIDLISEHCQVAPPLGDVATALSTIFVEVNEQVLYGVLSPVEGAAEYMRRAADAFI